MQWGAIWLRRSRALATLGSGEIGQIGCHALAHLDADFLAGVYQAPVLAMLAPGFPSSGSGSPFLRQLDGDAVGRAYESHMSVPGWPVDGDAAIGEPAADGVDAVDLIAEMAKVAAPYEFEIWDLIGVGLAKSSRFAEADDGAFCEAGIFGHVRDWLLTESKPLFEALRTWLRGPACPSLRQVGPRWRDPLHLNQWNSLVRFLEDGRIELDTNAVEAHHQSPSMVRTPSLPAMTKGHTTGPASPLTEAADSTGQRTACLLGCRVPSGLGSVINTAQVGVIRYGDGAQLRHHGIFAPSASSAKWWTSAKVRPGNSVAVFGCGGVGLNVIQGTRLVSALPIAVDRNGGRRNAALNVGTTHFVDASSGDPVEGVKEIVPDGVDFAFEAK